MKKTQKTLVTKLVTTLITSLIVLFSLSPAHAHFHYEGAVTTTFKLNNKNLLDALDISWTYDYEASEVMLKDNQDINALGDAVVSDLAKLGYFTRISFNEEDLKTKTVTKYKLEKVGKGEQTQLKLSFTLPLETPVSLKGKNFIVLDHTDPSGSAILYYESDKNIVLNSKIDPHCITLIKEKPDFEHGQSPQDVSLFCEAPAKL